MTQDEGELDPSVAGRDLPCPKCGALTTLFGDNEGLNTWPCRDHWQPVQQTTERKEVKRDG